MKLIVEMEMPTGCANCPMGDDDSRFCKAAKKYIPMLGKPSWCPIKGELPDEHGDLIDRDALYMKINSHSTERPDLTYRMGLITEKHICLDDICRAKAVIKAERKDDEQIH